MSHFWGFDELPESVKEKLQKNGASDIVMAAVSDLNRSGEYAEVWVAADSDNLYVVSGDEFARYSFDEIESFDSEDYIATGVLIAKLGGDDFVVAAYTNTCVRKFARFARALSKLKKKERLSEDDFRGDERDEFCPNCGRPYSDKQRKICSKCMNKKALFLRVLSYAPRYIWEIGGIVLLILLNSAIGLLRPYANGRVLFDQVLTPGGKYYGAIWQIVLAMIALEVSMLAIHIFQGRVGASVSAKIIYDIKVEVFSAMQRLSMSFYTNKLTGSLMTRVNGDALDIQYFLNDGLPSFIVNALTLIGIACIMISYNPFLALLVFLPVPFIVYIVRRVVPKFRKVKWHTWVKNSKLNSVINDTLSGMRVVKAFGRENAEIQRFERSNKELYDINIKAGIMSVKTFPVLSYIMSIGGLFVWSFGGWSVASGKMTFGVLMTFVNYIGMIYGPINFMINTFDWWQNCMTAAQRIFEIIDRKSDVPEAATPVRMPKIKGDIKLENVTFSYEPNKPVLHNINLEIKSGEMIGLVGHSGAGKSTITNLITRLYDVDEGAIYIDGVNIKDISLKDLRSQIGMVLQETFLFTGTIAENIAYARPDATMEEIISAAKLANAHDFIMRLPDGYETVLGMRHSRLSGGEQQRIAIARAILVNPKILILDEATASVDTETERLIQEALERLIRGRTTIAIAHRLSTLRNADRIVVVDKGTIVEVGTHEELEAKKGIYYQLLKIQREALKMRGVGVKV